MIQASCSAFNLPSELHFAIIQQIDDSETLASCARVCKPWHKDATETLWHGGRITTPSAHVLAGIATRSPQRFAAILPLIHTLDLHVEDDELLGSDASEDEGYYEHLSRTQIDRKAINTLTKSRAFALHLMASDIKVSLNPKESMPSDELLSQLLHPQLLRLNLENVVVGDDILAQVSGKCPRLEYFRLTGRKVTCSAKSARRFLESMQQLRSVYLPDSCFTDDDGEASNSIYARLLLGPHLENLRFDGESKHLNRSLHRQHVEGAMASSRHEILPRIRQLCLTLDDSSLLAGLLSSARHLQSIALTFERDETNVDPLILEPISRLPLLSELRLRFKMRADFSVHGIAAVAQGCPQLKSVALRSPGAVSECVVSEDGVKHLASLCNRLERLEVNVPILISESPFLQSMFQLYRTSDIMALEHGLFKIPPETRAALRLGLESMPQLRMVNPGERYSHGNLISSIISTIGEICSKREPLKGSLGTVSMLLEEEFEERKRVSRRGRDRNAGI